MKKLLLLTAIAPLAFSSVMSHAESVTSGGTINFSGKVTDATCTINGNNPASLTVPLNPITSAQAGETVGLVDVEKKAFSLSFSDCSSAKTGNTEDPATLKIQFSSANTISNDGKYLINQENDANGNPLNVGIAIVLQSAESTPLELNKVLDTKIQGNTSDPETVNFYAKYYKTDTQPAEAGNVRTMVTYSISYL